jgi:hypothetical protein
MKLLTTILIALTLFVTFPTQALEELQCGTKIGENGVQIEPKNSTLCEKDLTKSIFAIGLGQITQDEEYKYFFTPDPDVPRSVQIMAFTGDVGDKLMVMFRALAQLIIMVGAFGLVVNGIRASMSLSAGNGLNGDAKKKWIIIKQLGAIGLLAPIHSGLSFATLIVIKAGFIGAMLGNYFQSTLLSQELVKTTQAEVDPIIQWNEAEVMANETTRTQSIITRTIQQVLNQNFTTASYFNEDYQDGDSGMDFDDYDEKIRECMTPYIKQTIDPKTSNPNGYLFQNPDKEYCFEEFSEGTTGDIWDSAAGLVVGHVNDSKSYGNPHVIASIKYNNPNYAQMFHGQDGVVNNVSQVLTGEHDVEGTVKDLIDKYQTNTYFKSFKDSLYSSMYELVDANEKDFAKAEAAFISKVILMADDFGENIYNDISDMSRIENKNEHFKSNAIFAKSLGILNSLFGLNENGDGDQYRLDGKQEHKFGILHLMDEAKLAADFIEQAHCSKRFFQLIKSQKTQIGMTNLSIDPTNEDLVETVMFKQIPAKNFECIKVTGTEYNDSNSTEDYEFKYNINSSDIDVLTMFDLDEETDREFLGINDTYTTFESKSFSSKEAKKEHRFKLHAKLEKHYLDSVREANKHKLALKAYYFYVKRAVITALGKALKDNTDTEILVESRQLGFASSGSLLLKMSLSGGDASKMSNQIMSSVDITSFGDNDTLVNAQAIYSKENDNKESDKQASQFEVAQLTKFLDNGFYRSGQGSYSKSSTMESDIEQSERSVNFVQRWFDQLLFSSFDYLKQSNGFDVNLTLEEGLAACKNGTGKCIGDVSAIAGFMQSGNALIERAIQFYILQAVLNMANNAVNAGDDSGAESSFKSLGKFVGGALGILKIVLGFILQAITVFINTISIVFPFMLAVGFWLSYILPSVPFIAFSIAYLSWIILILTTIIVIQIQIARALVIDGEANNVLTFKFFWEILAAIILKPMLLVFSITIVYAMYEIVLFFLNSVFGFYTSATRTEGLIVGIFTDFIYKIVYLAIGAFSVMWLSMQIPTIVEEILEKLGLRGSNDTQSINNMGVMTAIESYATKMASDKVAGGMQKAVGKSHEYSNDLFTNLRKQEEEKLEASGANTNKPVENEEDEKTKSIGDKIKSNMRAKIDKNFKN